MLYSLHLYKWVCIDSIESLPVSSVSLSDATDWMKEQIILRYIIHHSTNILPEKVGPRLISGTRTDTNRDLGGRKNSELVAVKKCDGREGALDNCTFSGEL